VIKSFSSINDVPINSEEVTEIGVAEQKLKINDHEVEIKDPLVRLILLPVKFHEKLIGFIILGFENEEQLISANEKDMLKRFSILVSPVIFSLEPVRKSVSSYENIVSKIIKDRVHEARLMLNPIAFSIFRLGFQETISDSLVLEDALKTFQKEFHRILSEKGDLVWLTTDTAFFMQSNADLFAAESLASELKEDLTQLCSLTDTIPVAFLKYACISYPQSGENAIDIINNLWLKLFEEIYLMEQ
jgi:hypothetical protein